MVGGEWWVVSGKKEEVFQPPATRHPSLAMPESPFSKLPSLSELLKHPTVQEVTRRINQTTLAQRATGFWDELQATWKEPGAVPSVGELAERLAHRLLGRSSHSAPIVNATGVICSGRWQAPLAEPAVHELLCLASDYSQPSAERMNQVSTSLKRLTGAEAAWVASSFEAAVSMASQCEGATVVSSPLIGLLDPAEFGLGHVDTIADRLGAGADLVVVDGGGLLGGPRCGIVMGASRFVERLQQSELALALAADAMVLAALEATLEIYRTPEKVMHQIPVFQLLSAPLENLQQRCQRIAPQLAECAGVATAEAKQCQSVWLDSGEEQLVAESWAIALRLAQGSLQQFAEGCAEATPQVIGRTMGEEFWLDFRAIFPRWDQQLIAAVDGAN